MLSEKFQTSFRRRCARGDRYPLLWALYETFHVEFLIGGFCAFVASILQVLAPFILRYLISFAAEAYSAPRRQLPAPNIGHGIGLVVAITVMQLLQSLSTSHFIYRGQMVGGEARGVLISVIFQKAMKLSGRAKAGGKAIAGDNDQKNGNSALPDPSTKDGPFRGRLEKLLFRKKASGIVDSATGISGDGSGWANGRVVNLMSTDTYRIDQASGMFHMVWTSPVSILITLVLLVVNLTYSAVAGIALLAIAVPLITKAIKNLFARRQAINKITDKRVSLTQEILQAVKFVKYFGWESSFLERIGDIRKREVQAIQILLTIRSAINAVSMSLPIFASMLSFITYSLSKHPLDPAPIFSSLALFNSLRMPLNLLPVVIGQVTDAWASMKRIQDFLLAEEQHDDFVWDMEGKDAVALSHADFTWERTATRDVTEAPPTGLSAEKGDGPSTLASIQPFRLLDMDFSVGRGELVAVIGGVGSGKSSLLAALAGDMRRTNGSLTMGATRAFCPQYAWIQNTTVRENILFGKVYDPTRYDKVIDACALRPDLDMLPNSDQTEIGERGITVSGGQKQRLNIARAIYFNTDLILMDDPLSGELRFCFFLVASPV